MFKPQNHYIYVVIRHKYQNPVIPSIPRLLTSYLLEHPDKSSLYLKHSSKLDLLLEKLAIVYQKNQELNILKEMICFMETNNE